MKKLSTLFALLAVLLSDVMCAAVAYSYCALQWGARYEGWSTGTDTAFLLAVPYCAGIALCAALAIILRRRAA